MKLAAVGAATTAVLTGCGSGVKFEPSGELRRVNFDRETVIFNGKTIPVNELGMEAMAFYSDTKSRIKRKFTGDATAATRPASFVGAGFPQGWEINPDQATITIDQTEGGDYIAQALVKRRVTGDHPVSGSGGFNDIINDIATATQYNEHSLLVVGRGDRSLWFDNIQSVNDRGERVRVTVDAKKGKLYQIVTDSPSLFDKWFRGEQQGMDISEMNLVGGETEFRQVMTPLSEGFMGFVMNFINRLSADLTPERKLEMVNYLFSGAGISYNDLQTVTDLMGGAGDAQQYFDIMTRYRANIPFDSYELALANTVVADMVQKSAAGFNVDPNNWAAKIKSPIPPIASLNIDVVNKLIAERVSLPKAAPDVYFVKVKEKKDEGETKWFAVGRYSVWENDVDRTGWTPLRDGFAIGQYWFTYGEVSEDVVDNQGLRPYEKAVDGFPYDEVKTMDNNLKKPLNADFWGGLYDLDEVRQVGKEAVKWGWDPAEGDPRHKVNPGFFLTDTEGQDHFMKLVLDNTWGTNLYDLPLLSNRPIPLLGNSPRVIKDVTDEVDNLIRDGQATTSPFLDDYADYHLLANLHEGANGFLNFDFINANFTPEALLTLVPPGQFITGGTDNAMLIYTHEPEGNQINIAVHDSSTGDIKRLIPVTHPVIISPLSVIEYRDGGGGITIAEDKTANETYVVREQDMFPLGARSTEKLRTIVIGEAALTIAALYGGYMALASSTAGKGFLGNLTKILFSKMVR